MAISIYVSEDSTIIIHVGGVEKDAEAWKPITLPPKVNNGLKWAAWGLDKVVMHPPTRAIKYATKNIDDLIAIGGCCCRLYGPE
jgi:hypothetical protein